MSHHKTSSKWAPAQTIPLPTAFEPSPHPTPCTCCGPRLPDWALCPPGAQGGWAGLQGLAPAHRRGVHLQGTCPGPAPIHSPRAAAGARVTFVFIHCCVHCALDGSRAESQSRLGPSPAVLTAETGRCGECCEGGLRDPGDAIQEQALGVSLIEEGESQAGQE